MLFRSLWRPAHARPGHSEAWECTRKPLQAHKYEYTRQAIARQAPSTGCQGLRIVGVVWLTVEIASHTTPE